MKHTILLVDDEPNVLEGLQRHLVRLGCEILTAESGEEAIKLFARWPIDLVISDHDMPGMSGGELLAYVHENYPDTVRYMLTGKATLDIAVDAINHGGINRFFVKPCNAADVMACVGQSLLQKDLIQEARLLLYRTRKQSLVLDSLEHQYPGITQVQRDEHGVIDLDGIPTKADDLIAECRRDRVEE